MYSFADKHSRPADFRKEWPKPMHKKPTKHVFILFSYLCLSRTVKATQFKSSQIHKIKAWTSQIPPSAYVINLSWAFIW